MLREITSIKPQSGHATKQWFNDEAMDLFVWRNGGGHIDKFQLAYKEGLEEYTVSWTPAAGFTFHIVDDGEKRTGRYKATPILLPGGPSPLRSTIAAFIRRAQQLEPALREFIETKLECAVQAEPHE